jgi:hypothetical protein
MSFENEVYSNLSTGLYCLAGKNFDLRFIFIYERNSHKADPRIDYNYYDFSNMDYGSFSSLDIAYINAIVPITDPAIVIKAEQSLWEHCDEKTEEYETVKKILKILLESKNPAPF